MKIGNYKTFSFILKVFFIMAFFPSFLLAQANSASSVENLKKDDPLKEIDAVRSYYESGDHFAALEHMLTAVESFWNHSPLGVRKVAFLLEPPETLGRYKLKEGETFKMDEPLIIYCEALGFTQLPENGGYKYSLIGSFEILDAEGKTIGGQSNLGPYGESGYYNFKLGAELHIRIGMQGLPAGDYVLKVTWTDNLDPSKSVQFKKQFTLLE